MAIARRKASDRSFIDFINDRIIEFRDGISRSGAYSDIAAEAGSLVELLLNQNFFQNYHTDDVFCAIAVPVNFRKF